MSRHGTYGQGLAVMAWLVAVWTVVVWFVKERNVSHGTVCLGMAGFAMARQYGLVWAGQRLSGQCWEWQLRNDVGS